MDKKNKRFSLNNMYLRNVTLDHDSNMSLLLDEKYINNNRDDSYIGVGRATLTFSRLAKDNLKISYYQDNHKKELSLHEFKDHLLNHTVEIVEEMHGNNVSYFNCLMDKMELDIKIYHDNEVNYSWELKK